MKKETVDEARAGVWHTGCGRRGPAVGAGAAAGRGGRRPVRAGARRAHTTHHGLCRFGVVTPTAVKIQHTVH